MVKFRRIPAFESSTRKDLVVEKKRYPDLWSYDQKCTSSGRRYKV